MKKSDIFRDIVEEPSEDEHSAIGLDIVPEDLLSEVEAIVSSHEEWESLEDKPEHPKKRYERAKDIIPEDYSLQAFKDALMKISQDIEYAELNDGVFASALWNELEEEEARLDSDTLFGFNGSEFNDNHGFGLFNSSNITVEGDLQGMCFSGMRDGKVKINGWATKIGTAMEGGSLIVQEGASQAGFQMNGGYIEINDYVKHAAQAQTGGELGVNGDVSNLGTGAEGIVWANGDAESVGANLQGGTVYVAGEAESVGRRSEDGEIYVEGEIETIGKECSAQVYQWKNGGWELVHEGEDKQIHSKTASNTRTSNKTPKSSSYILESEESYEELEDMEKTLELENDDYLIDEDDSKFYQEESYEAKDSPAESDDKLRDLNPLSEKPIEEQLRDEE